MAIEDPYWPRADRWLASGAERPDLLVVGVPTSAASLSPSRADRTPAALRAVLGRFSTFHSEREIDVASLAVRDLGDLPVSDLPMERLVVELAAMARDLPDAPVRVYLGGDNAITRPLVRSLGDLDRVGVLTLDAHHDVRTLDLGPTNGSPIRGLIEEDGLPDGHVVQIGIHSFANSTPYRRWCEAHGIEVITMALVETWGIEEAVGVGLDRLARVADRIYVDIDIDVLDRAFAPGCPGARPGGMTPRQLAEAAFWCGRHPQVVAVDLVEVDAEADRDDLTVMNMANAFLSFAAGVADRKGR